MKCESDHQYPDYEQLQRNCPDYIILSLNNADLYLRPSQLAGFMLRAHNAPLQITIMLLIGY